MSYKCNAERRGTSGVTERMKTVRCLKDSGAQTSLIQKDLIKDVDAQVLGTVTIKGVIGQPAEAALVTLKIKPTTSSSVVLHSLQLLDAVAWSAVEHSIAVVDPGQLRPSGAMVRLLVFVSDQTPQKSLKR